MHVGQQVKIQSVHYLEVPLHAICARYLKGGASLWCALFPSSWRTVS